MEHTRILAAALCLALLVPDVFALSASAAADLTEAQPAPSQPAPGVGAAQPAPGVGAAQPPLKLEAILTPAAYEVAKDLGLVPAFEHFQAAQQTETPGSLPVLRLREQLIETVLVASFEIRAALSKIDRDIAQANEMASVLKEQTERRVQKTDAMNFVQSGITEILSTGLSDFGRNNNALNVAGAIFGVIGGSGEIGISSYGLHASKGKRRITLGESNMLAPVFGLQPPNAKYPEGVWHYINDPAPGSPLNETRRRRLIELWIRLKRIESPNTPNGRRQVALLCDLLPNQRAVNVDLLEDRSLMLEDLRAVVSHMDQELLEIMRCIDALG